MDDIAGRSAISAAAQLADPTRRALYRIVAASPHPLARDEAAEAAGVSVALAAFHLDRLTAAGLLETEFRRRSGRQGPGAGRPAKLYRRAATTIDFSLPARRYGLAATLLAEAVAEAGSDAIEALRRVARTWGREVAASLGKGADGEVEARRGVPAEGAFADDARRGVPAEGAAWTAGRPARAADTGQGATAAEGAAWAAASAQGAADGTATRDGDALLGALAACGFEPRADPDGRVVRLCNCPFAEIARVQRDVACPMNFAIVEGLAEGIGGGVAEPDGTPGHCCVAVRRT